MEERDFFSRCVPVWGAEKMKKVRESSVAVAGAGGLGCGVAEILVRSGIGRLVLIDYGKVDVPDLNRQILFSMEDIGKSKVAAAAEKLRGISPFTEVVPVERLIQEHEGCNVLLRDMMCAVVADCLDNFPGRFALERAMPEGASLVHGGVEQDYGQVTTVVKGKTPSLRELYFDSAVSTAGVSVSPPVVSALGSIMAQEVLNVLWGVPSLQGKMLIVEFRDFSFFHLALQ